MKFDWSVIADNWPLLLQGAGVTVMLTFATMALALPGGMVLTLMRMSRLAPVRAFATGFVEFFRTTPIILQVYWVFYVLPVLIDFRASAFATGLIALTLNVSAFNSETFRSGINSIRAGQRNAALALGMSEWQALRIVIIPQAIHRVLPALASTWVSLFKDTSLVVIIGIFDLTQAAKTAVADAAWRGFSVEAYLFIAFIYFVFCFSISRYSQSLEKHLEHGYQR